MLKLAQPPKTRFAARRFLLLSVALVMLAGCTAPPAPMLMAPAHVVTQISTYPALEKGLFDGDTTFAELERMGDFGMGTFDGMDGEMIALDGEFYQARSDGQVRRAEGSQETPFATVTFFKSDQHLQPDKPLATYDQLKAYLSKAATPANRPYAIKLAGRFPAIKIRSVAWQAAPYPPLADVVAEQVTWERREITGTLVGYWIPQYLSALNAPGFHLHFISDDRQTAGHVLELSVKDPVIDLDYLDQVMLRLPGTEAFGAADLSGKP